MVLVGCVPKFSVVPYGPGVSESKFCDQTTISACVAVVIKPPSAAIKDKWKSGFLILIGLLLVGGFVNLILRVVFRIAYE